MREINAINSTTQSFSPHETTPPFKITRPVLQDPLYSLLNAVSEQRHLKENKSVLSIESIQKSIEAARQLRLKSMEKLDGMQSKATYSYYLSWAKEVLDAALVLGALVSVGTIIFTGGAALPPLIVAAESMASVTSGAVTATKAVLDYQRNLKEGERQELRTRQQISQQQVQKMMKELQTLMNEITQEWKHARNVLDRREQAIKTVNKR